MRKTSILLVEDNADHQRLLAQSLVRGRPTIRVEVTDTRTGALEAVESGEFDCVVLDYIIPPHTAPEVIEDLRQAAPGIPVLVVSSSEEQRVVIESMRNGVSDFVPKNIAINSDMLWSRIESAIESARKSESNRRTTNRRLRMLSRLAETDHLTGLHNRRGALRILSSSRNRNDRRVSTAVIMIDIDHFKSINDTYGHACGDTVLKAVAAEISRIAESPDTVIRWGGEEFMVLRPSDSIASAWLWSNRVRRSIEELEIHDEGRAVRVTASLGVDVVPTSELGDAIINRADRALYLAKETGRNKVCTWMMALATEIAEELQTDPSLRPADRLSVLAGRLRDQLGEQQLEHTGPHGLRVMRLAERLGASIGLNPMQIGQLKVAAQFHDIGKVAIPESILAAPRSLSRDEIEIVEEHARFGAHLVALCGGSPAIAESVARHHDRFDQQDPGLNASTDTDPAPEMILSVADALVTMLSQRTYASVKSIPEALAELQRERGSQFHPEVVDTAHALDPSVLQNA